MSRRSAREQVYKLVYEYCVAGENNDFSLELALNDCSDEDGIFIRKLYEGVIDKFEFLRNLTERFSKGFSFERIFKIDCALIMVAAYEILYLDDIPTGVSVNEALEFAKAYSTDKSYSFINGVLATVAAKKEEILNEEQDN